MGFVNYIIVNYNQVLGLLLEHIQLTAIAVIIALLIGVPLGIFINYFEKANKPVLGAANVVQAIPSMALLGFAIPLLGIGHKPAVIVVILYSLLPIIKNTYTGLAGINPETLEAAKGIGLTNSQILFKIKLPLALPVIMAGVRISAVTAVGLMTMAAFIGGGGLGYLVFSGIRTVNTDQILAGAIPACILALFIDFLGAVVENLVTPKSLLSKEGQAKARRRKEQKILLGVVAAIIIALFVFSGISGMRSTERTLGIGSKDFTEQVILCFLTAEAIEANTDITVIRHEALSGTKVCFGALRAKEIDMYVEYSGTIYNDILRHPAISDVEEVYQTAKRELKELFDIEALPQMAFNNTYTMAVRPETAQKYNLKTISDLARVSSGFIASTSMEFLNRDDGLPGLSKTYGLRFRSTKGIDGSPRYTAIINHESDVIDAFSTDGLLKKFDLVVLEDDKSFFPPYYAMPIMRSDVYENYPEIIPILNEVGQLLTNDVMMELNYQVDELQRKPEAVAHEFLVQHGLVK